MLAITNPIGGRAPVWIRAVVATVAALAAYPNPGHVTGDTRGARPERRTLPRRDVHRRVDRGRPRTRTAATGSGRRTSRTGTGTTSCTTRRPLATSPSGTAGTWTNQGLVVETSN